MCHPYKDISEKHSISFNMCDPLIGGLKLPFSVFIDLFYGVCNV